MEEILAGLASLASQKPQEYLTTLKGENGEWLSESELTEKLKGDISGHFKTIADNQHKRGLRERGEAIEKYIRDTYGINSTATGEDLVKELVEAQKGKTIEKPIELTKETALENPIVKELLANANKESLKDEVQKRTAELEKELETERKKFADYIQTAETAKVSAAIREKGALVLEAIKAKLGDDADEKARKLDFFFDGRSMDPSRFKLDENGDPYPINEKGEHLEDPKTFHKISFTDYVKSIQPYGVHTHDKSKGSPSPTTKQPGGSQPSGVTVNVSGLSATEFQSKLSLEKDPKVRAAMLEAYAAHLANQK